MSRLEAKAKLLYYRTPEPIVEAIARYLRIRPFISARVLDPCAGTGTALALLVQRLKEQCIAQQSSLYRRQPIMLETYGIEPELLRAKEAIGRLDHVLQTSFFSTTLSNGSGPDGGWQCAFVNPPYDIDTEISQRGRKTRLEVNFLRRVTDKLCSEGILIWIVPQTVLGPAAKFLAANYDQLTCIRFPDDEWQPDLGRDERTSLYGQFHQVILFACKRRYEVPAEPDTVDLIRAWAAASSTLRALPLDGRLEDVPWYTLPGAQSGELRHFSSGFYDPDATASLVATRITKTQRYKTGLWANADYLAARIPDVTASGFGIGTPMGPLKNAHLAVLSVAGIANRAVLEGKDGRRIIVKGYSRKVPVYTRYEDDEEIVEKVTDTFETALWCIDLETGGLIRVNTGKETPCPFAVHYETITLGAFLDNFGVSLTQQVAEANPPRYEGETSLPWVRHGFTLLKRKPLGKQREVILANVSAFIKGMPAFLPDEPALLERTAPVAEMASGKTYLSLCTAFLADRYACGGTTSALPGTRLQHVFPLVVLCPPIMARKWKREAEQTLPNARVVIIKRMGTPALTALPEDTDEDEEAMKAGRQLDDLADFRHFDPDFTGSSLSAIGCLDGAVTRIRKELAAWRRSYEHACALNAAIRRGEANEEIQPVPLKPCHIIVITSSTAKLGKEWMPSYRLKVARSIDPVTKKVKLRRSATGEPFAVPCCPHCFRPIKDARRINQLMKVSGEYRELIAQVEQQRTTQHLSAFEIEAREPVGLYLTEKDLLGTKEHRVKRFCSECGGALWQYVAARPTDWQPYSVLRLDKQGVQPLPLPSKQPVPPMITSTFRRRYPLGDYLKKRYTGFFHLVIADEVHEGSDGTALDFARQRLATACRRMMGLTGTLSNGYSASLFRLYYVLNPSVRRDFGYDEVERWIDLYGKRVTTIKTYKEKEEGHGSSSDRRIGKPVTREIAGFAPQGLAKVLPCSTFLELSDVVSSLPPYREEVREVELGNILGPAYEAFERETTQEIGRMLARGDKSGLSTWWNGLRTWPNLPYRGWTCMIKKTKEVFGTAPALPEDMLYPKERAIVEYVQQEYDAGRRVLIYTENTGMLDILPRLKKILETKIKGRQHKPISVAILRSTTVETIDREAWLDKQVEAGCDVLICNPKLVKVGLDLISFSTIIFASIPTSTSDLRQSSRRSFRPGQTRPVNVVFFVYPTMEWRLLRLMSRKMKASLMVEGKLPGEGLVSFGEDDEDNENDMYVALAREVLANLEAETPEDLLAQAQELQEIFAENAQIEREKNQSLGEEADVEPVEFDPIRVEELSVSASFSEDEDQAETEVPVEVAVESQVAVSLDQQQPTLSLAHEPEAQAVTMQRETPELSRATAKKKPSQVSSSRPEKVTIIHTSVTSGKDPWAALREKHPMKARRSRKVVAYPGDVPTLWEVIDTQRIAASSSEKKDASEQNKTEVIQRALW